MNTNATTYAHSQFKLFTVGYNFNHSKFGFNNSITVEALSQEQAIEKAKHEVSMCYGSRWVKILKNNSMNHKRRYIVCADGVREVRLYREDIARSYAETINGEVLLIIN